MRSNIYLMSRLKPSLASLEIIIILPNKVWNSITLWSLCTTRLVRIVRHSHTSCFSMIHELGLWSNFSVEFWNLRVLLLNFDQTNWKIWSNFEYCTNLQSFTNKALSQKKNNYPKNLQGPGTKGFEPVLRRGVFLGSSKIASCWGPGLARNHCGPWIWEVFSWVQHPIFMDESWAIKTRTKQSQFRS